MLCCADHMANPCAPRYDTLGSSQAKNSQRAPTPAQVTASAVLVKVHHGAAKLRGVRESKVCGQLGTGVQTAFVCSAVL